MEISKILSKMKAKKSSGWDNLSSQFIKLIGNDILVPLTIKFNQSLESGIFPETMKLAKIIPLYKSKEASELSNYRPISILPTLSKVLERLIYNRVYSFLTRENLLHKSQYGFRHKHSTINAVSDFYLQALQSIDKNETVISMFLDLSKAFDTLDHTILLKKLSFYGIRGLSLKWFKSYLDRRCHSVSFNNKQSDIFNINCGIPQGSILGPLLFIIYVNDLPLSLQHSKCILFADDTTIYASGHDITSLVTSINTDLLNVSEWFRANKLAANASKTSCIIFNNRNATSLKLSFDSQNISPVNCVKFLGLLIDSKLSWSEHTEHVKSKLSKALYVMNSLKHFVPICQMKNMYFTMVQPYINYGLLLWGNTFDTYLKPLIVKQKHALRIMCNVSYNAHTSALFKRHSIIKLQDMFVIESCIFMFRLIHNQLPIGIQKAFTPSSSLHAHSTRQQCVGIPFKPRNNKKIVLRSILHTAPSNFANLSNEIKVCETMGTFKRKLGQFIFNEY